MWASHRYAPHHVEQVPIILRSVLLWNDIEFYQFLCKDIILLFYSFWNRIFWSSFNCWAFIFKFLWYTILGHNVSLFNIFLEFSECYFFCFCVFAMPSYSRVSLIIILPTWNEIRITLSFYVFGKISDKFVLILSIQIISQYFKNLTLAKRSFAWHVNTSWTNKLHHKYMWTSRPSGTCPTLLATQEYPTSWFSLIFN